MGQLFLEDATLADLQIGMQESRVIQPSTAPKPLELVTILSSLMFLGGMLFISAVIFLLEIILSTKDFNEKRVTYTKITFVKPIQKY